MENWNSRILLYANFVLSAEEEAEKKRRKKQQEQVIKRWQRLIQGLRIRQRLQEQYADRTPQINAADATGVADKPVGLSTL